tara:strand:+ start:674 stop:820 length:147 start_codon:yes stop_codon:yes gene_type:complete
MGGMNQMNNRSTNAGDYGGGDPQSQEGHIKIGQGYQKHDNQDNQGGCC